jgi:hypothetical protein
LNDLSDLPKVEDMSEALGLEGGLAPLLVERIPNEDMLPLEEPEPEIEPPAGQSGGSRGSVH